MAKYTFAQIDEVIAGIARYRGQKRELEQFATICGGYLHYHGYSASLIDKSMTEKIRLVLVQEMSCRCHATLSGLEVTWGIHVEGERDEIDTIVRKSLEVRDAD